MADENGEKRTQPWHFDIYEEDDGGYASIALKFMRNCSKRNKGYYDYVYSKRRLY